MEALSERTKEDIKSYLSRVEEPDVADRLNDWERGFLESVRDQFGSREWLSENQINKLKTISEGKDDGPNRRFKRPSKNSYGRGDAAGRFYSIRREDD